MSAIVPLTAGANQPLDGQRVAVEVIASNLGGAMLLAEDGGAVRPLAAGDPLAPVTLGAQGARLEIALAAIPAPVTRLRLLAWSESRARLLVPVRVRVSVDGAERFEITIPDRPNLLRAAEVLEIYRRHGSWKVRAIASGWEDHIPAMARGVGLPESAFAAAPARPSQAGPGGHAPGRAEGRAGPGSRGAAHHGPSPNVGPPALRGLLDGIVGPGPRRGDARVLNFELQGVDLGLLYEEQDGGIQVVALAPLGNGPFNDATAEAALRVTGEAPLARVTIGDDGAALAAAVTYAQRHNLDSALLKALLSEVWVAAHAFMARAAPIGWRGPAHVTADVPRELRLGVAEELQSAEVWGEVRERLEANDFVALADEPATMLARGDGQLRVGPTLLAGTTRAWAIVVERILRADVTPRAGLWRELSQHNSPQHPVRFGVVDETGVHGPPAITANFAALQLPRTQVMEDLQFGLEFVDRASADLDPALRRFAPDADARRADVPAIATRRWTGPGSELRDELLARELLGVPAGAPVPVGFMNRVNAQRSTIGRPGIGYLGHLALARAERRDGAAASWLELARDLVAMSPIHGTGAPCATASLHVRLRRLTQPPPPPRPTGQDPAPPPPPPAPGGGGGAPRRRWRLFG